MQSSSRKASIDIVYAGQLDKPRDSPWGKTVGDQKRGLEFDQDQYDIIDFTCKGADIPWFASAWDLQSLQFLERYDLPCNKIASAMATNEEFVKAVAKQGKKTFASTGMCTEEQIFRMVKLLKPTPTILLHCVGTYPADEKDLNLNMIRSLKKFGCPVGYSGHETSVSPSVMAVVLGAEVIERHITLDRAMYGSDQAASLGTRGI